MIDEVVGALKNLHLSMRQQSVASVSNEPVSRLDSTNSLFYTPATEEVENRTRAKPFFEYEPLVH